MSKQKFTTIKDFFKKDVQPTQKTKNLQKPDIPQERRTNNDPPHQKKEVQDENATNVSSHSRSNIGWLYYKDYYHGIDFKNQTEAEIKRIFEQRNDHISSRKLSYYRDEVNALILDFKTVQRFELTTEYPGLVTGLGSPHETHHEGEFKLGFSFDHTTGLPIIPGSSVKGILRSAFQQSDEYIQYLLNDILKKSISLEEVVLLERDIFDGKVDEKEISLYKRDVFFDAVLLKSDNKDSKFLSDDFITPHPDEFKNPVPLQFLKVLPQVTFRFQFRLFPIKIKDVLIIAENKLDLFKRILLDLGIGAKTNVGYGKFKE